MSEYSRLNSDTEEERIKNLKKEANTGDFSSSQKLADYYLNRAIYSKTTKEIFNNGKKCFKYLGMYVSQYKEYISRENCVSYPEALMNAETNQEKLFITNKFNHFNKNEETCLNRFAQQIEILRLKQSKNSMSQNVNNDLFSTEKQLSVIDEDLFENKTHGCQIC